MSFNSEFLQRTLFLAQRGGTFVAPNPMVGALLVFDNEIIAEGWHEKFGGPHAEVNAIRQVEDKEKLKKCTLYVSLEPCNHFGKTPPCTELIIQTGITKVVVGSLDPNPLVAGKGIKRLQDAGIEVVVNNNILEFQKLNQHFFLNQKLNRPWITLKWAQSIDGYIGKKGTKTKISDSLSNIYTHKLRATHQAIWVGTQTALTDQPILNTRFFPGNHPIRIFSDRECLIPRTTLENPELQTIVITEEHEMISQNVDYLTVNSVFDLKNILDLLYKEKKIGSILVEGGARLLQSFIDSDLADELYVIQNSKKLSVNNVDNQLIKAPKLSSQLTLTETNKIQEDLWCHYQRTNEYMKTYDGNI